MSYVTTTGLDLIVGALRRVGALEAGETPNAQDTDDAFRVLNDFLDMLSITQFACVASTENILTFVPGQAQYTIGNPTGGTFTGTLASGSPTISGVTVPSNLIIGGTLTDVQAAIPAGTTITAIGANTLTMSANALFTVSSAEVITYTVPGNFSVQRPLRITGAFTRVTASGNTGLDYSIDFEGGQDKYTAIGMKGIAGPWPVVGWYNPTFPYGNLYFYPVPSQAGVLHLFTDNIFTNFTSATQSVNLPQGYAMMLQTNLAVWLWPEYKLNAPLSPELKRQADASMQAIKALNAIPAVQAFYDRDLVRTRRNDAGWIMHGGFQ